MVQFRPKPHPTVAVTKGDSVPLRVTIGDGSGGVKDLTSASVEKWVMRRGSENAFDDEAVIADDSTAGVDITFLEPRTNGQVLIDLSSSFTATLEPGAYYEQLHIIDANGVRRMALHGSIAVESEA